MTWRERGNEYRQVESFWGNREKRKREKEQDIGKRDRKTEEINRERRDARGTE